MVADLVGEFKRKPGEPYYQVLGKSNNFKIEDTE